MRCRTASLPAASAVSSGGAVRAASLVGGVKGCAVNGCTSPSEATQRPLGTAALLLHSAKVVQLLHAFSFMPVGSHDKMLQHAAEQKGLRVVTSEQRLFFPARRSVDDLGEPC